MMDLQQAMNVLTTKFVSDAQVIARRAAIAALEQVRLEPSLRESSMPSVRGRPPGSSRPKRSPAALDELSKQFMQFVKVKPGLRIEQINKELGTTTKALALPIRKLAASGDLVIKGQKRSTTYYVNEPGKPRARVRRKPAAKSTRKA
jgi:hypothetical protein